MPGNVFQCIRWNKTIHSMSCRVIVEEVLTTEVADDEFSDWDENGSEPESGKR